MQDGLKRIAIQAAGSELALQMPLHKARTSPAVSATLKCAQAAELLRAGVAPWFARDSKGQSCVCRAAAQNVAAENAQQPFWDAFFETTCPADPDAAKELLSAPDERGQTCLEYARAAGRVALVEQMLKWGASKAVGLATGTRIVDFIHKVRAEWRNSSSLAASWWAPAFFRAGRAYNGYRLVVLPCSQYERHSYRTEGAQPCVISVAATPQVAVAF